MLPHQQPYHGTCGQLSAGQLPPRLEGGGRSGSGGGDKEIHPIIRGLLARLPKSAEVRPEAERKLWLDLLARSFKLIYKDAPATAAPHESSEARSLDS